MSAKILFVIIIVLIAIQLWLKTQFKQHHNKKKRGRFTPSERRKEQTLRHLVDDDED